MYVCMYVKILDVVIQRTFLTGTTCFPCLTELSVVYHLRDDVDISITGIVICCKSKHAAVIVQYTMFNLYFANAGLVVMGPWSCALRML